MSAQSDPWAWIEARQRFGIAPGLARTRALLHAVGDPQRALSVTLVAGTNGKGSTTALLAAMLTAAERKPVGRFVSPHLQRFEERFTLGATPIAPPELARVLDLVRPHADALGATFFEVLVAVACVAFARAGVGHAVLEVGMGGRWDATNACDPELSLIAQVALDHEAILGPDVASIAAEKAGILRAGVPAVTSAEGEARAVIEARAREIAAPLTVIDDVPHRAFDLGWDGVALEGLGDAPIRTSLIGAHQARNLALATLGARALGVPWPAIAAGAAAVRWPGRLERLDRGGVRFLLDGAHNPAGAQALAAALTALGTAPAVAVVGVGDDRLGGDLPAALVCLAPRIVVARASASPRAAAVDALEARLMAAGATDVVGVGDPAAALAHAERLARAEGAPAPTIVVAGSLYLVGEVRALLLGEAPERFERHQ